MSKVSLMVDHALKTVTVRATFVNGTPGAVRLPTLAFSFEGDVEVLSGADAPSGTGPARRLRFVRDEVSPLGQAEMTFRCYWDYRALPTSFRVLSGDTVVEEIAAVETDAVFKHPGILNSTGDFERMRAAVEAGEEPWASGWDALRYNFALSTTGPLRPSEKVINGASGENYAGMYIDIQHAYALALGWKVTGRTDYADRCLEYLDRWAATLKEITGWTQASLTAGIAGYQWAATAEIMRDYDGWAPEKIEAFKAFLKGVILHKNRGFLRDHYGTEWSEPTNYWANWDLFNLNAVAAIGIFCDDLEVYQEAIDYFHNGRGNGALDKMVPHLHPGQFGQWQESGRDQGHTTLGIALVGCLCEMAWQQGDDLYGARNHRILAAAEYVAKTNYQLEDGGFAEMPFSRYRNRHGTMTAISTYGRPHMRNGWERIYNHYAHRLGLSAPWTGKMRARIAPEGVTRGRSDEPGYGTLTASLPRPATGARPSGLTALRVDGRIRLDWWGGFDDVAYEVQRAAAGSDQFTSLANIDAEALRSFTDTPEAGRWVYRIAAEKADGETVLGHDEVEVVAPGSLIFHLPLDDGEGGTARDATGRSAGGVLMPGAGWGEGRNGTAALDLTKGDYAYLDLPTGMLAGVADHTIALWVKAPSNPPENSSLFSFWNDDIWFMALRARVWANKWSMEMRAEYTRTSYKYVEDKVYSEHFHPGNWLNGRTDRWVHVALVVKGNAGRIYLDGEPKGEETRVEIEPHQFGGMKHAHLGKGDGRWNPTFKGLMQDFRIYDRALERAEIEELMA